MPLAPRLSVYRWRPPMVASLAHRASGIVLVLFLPAYVWLFDQMTRSPEAFARVALWLRSGLGRVVLWVVATAAFYHLLNGIRFLLLDFGLGEARETMRKSASFVLAAAAAFALLLVGVLG